MTPPGSKSLTNRAMVLAALGRGPCQLDNVLLADDTRVMIDALRQLGFELALDEGASRLTVQGRAGEIPSQHAKLFCGNSGTTIRFLAALCALGRGRFDLDGIARMRQRPIGQLVELLRQVGTRVQYLGEAGFPPISVLADGLPGGMMRFGAALSSQYLSAILMSAPYARHEVRVGLFDRQTSWPYVAMTLRLMDAFGLTPELTRDPTTGEPCEIIVPQGAYQQSQHTIEPDASNATYFLAAAAIRPGARLTIQGLGRQSLQGDIGFADVLQRMGVERLIKADSVTVAGTDRLEGIDVDLQSMPDTAQTLAVVAVFASGPSVLRGLHTLRVKETDRLVALSNELTKLGATVAIDDDTLRIDPPKVITPASIDTYDDHRMAMSFAVAGTRAPGITIRDPACVNKTYPGFFADLEKLRPEP